MLDLEEFQLYSCSRLFDPPLIMTGMDGSTPPEPPSYVRQSNTKALQEKPKPSVVSIMTKFVNSVESVFDGKNQFDGNSTLKQLEKIFKGNKENEENFIYEWLKQNKPNLLHYFTQDPNTILANLLMDLLRYFDFIEPPFAQEQTAFLAETQGERLKPKKSKSRIARRPRRK
ncbi:hypothetical protein M0811_10367 [Anaeramoeba ignava]|uniref:Uncharacterized protein n=1 Tax=Anaeramoeba ignava TaxID=1746090 RepID=A0A9Q0LF55_ANAIG|nr:hypothetical protein M0811_10367 [Anaeramoeba ignava]|eukprot:Anaeramoba_ignava/a3433_21.p1 GENE.a3433_21~~a3433_21.p1  ORF type:complete len:172 (+),score=60.60 a3433_21:30-545(+)